MHLLFGLLMAAAAAGQPVAEIFLPNMNDHGVNRALGLARGVVEDVYADIGVQVVWRIGNTPPSGCEKKPGRRQIVFDLKFGIAKGRNPDALAFAQPYLHEGSCVTLLMDRLHEEAARNPDTTGILLGNVLAHEIGHVLQGIERHSETGLMKARWSARDIREMWRTPLRFSDIDVELVLEPFRVFPSQGISQGAGRAH
ncbi:MAG: hypothetical protein ABJF23_06580 [Bryobacteraceae bacterium]